MEEIYEPACLLHSTMIVEGVGHGGIDNLDSRSFAGTTNRTNVLDEVARPMGELSNATLKNRRVCVEDWLVDPAGREFESSTEFCVAVMTFNGHSSGMRR